MTLLIIVAHVETHPERGAQIDAELRALALASRAEQGCLHYQICRDLETPDARWLIYEVWQSEAHFRAHLATPHLQRFKTDVLHPDEVLRADKLARV